jgi:choline dehydrogenase-like flavoprotein
VPYSGWPFGYHHLEPFYRRAEELIDLSGTRYDQSAWSAVGVEPPAFDPDKLGSGASWLPVRKNFARLYGGELRRADNVTVLINASATAIRPHPGRTAAEGVVMRAATGRFGRVSAAIVVLCAGGIETPRLMLASRDWGAAGTGNAHDVVGRFFQDHPTAEILELHPRDGEAFARLYRPHNGRRHRVFPKIRLGLGVQRASGVLNATADIVYQAPEDSVITRARDFYGSLRAARAGAAVASAWRLARVSEQVPHALASLLLERRSPVAPGSRIVLYAHVEQAPDPDSRITLGDGLDALGQPRARIDWRISELECRTFSVFAETVASEMTRTGLADARFPDWLNRPDWRDNVSDFYHHMGATRMGTDPSVSAVDPDLKVHGIDNLFVASAAVFPTGGASNPMLTLLALTLRLADRLKQRHGTTPPRLA